MYNIEYLKCFYKEFLDDCCADGMDFFKTGDREDFYKWYDKRCNSEDFSAAYGATKMVLWEDTLPYVIKVPFLDSRSGFRDYCRIELSNYKKVQKIPEIVDMFAEVEFLFEYCGFPVYIMEKVSCDEEEISSRAYEAAFDFSREQHGMYNDGSPEYEGFCDNFCSNYYNWSAEEQMEDFLFGEWGFTTMKKFEDFCSKNNINDLHSGNWGWRKDRLVVVDYSGY